jgi:hypothetical protein
MPRAGFEAATPATKRPLGSAIKELLEHKAEGTRGLVTVVIVRIIRTAMSSRMIRMRHEARARHIRNAYKVLFGKSERKIPQGKPRRGLKYNTNVVV